MTVIRIVRNRGAVAGAVVTGDEVATVGLTSGAGGTQPFSIGHGFAKGDVPSGSDIVSDTAGITLRAVPRRRWNDGSVKHAILCGSGTFTAGGETTISLKTGTAAGGSNLTSSDIQSAAPSASTQCGAIGTVNLSSLLASPFRTWVSTPEMVECHYRSQVGSDTDLIAWFHVKLFVGGKVHIRAFVDNGFRTTSPSDKTYTATVLIGGVTVHNASITHESHTRWNVEAWIGGDPEMVPSHDVPYLLSTKLVPNYWKRSPAAATLNGLQQTYAPMQLAPHPTAGATGGFANHIGPLTRWDALYCTTGDPRPHAAVLTASSALTTYSICRPETSGRISKPTDAPTFTIEGGGAGTFSITNTAGIIEFNHLQNSGYLAYLISGDYFHYEQMALLTSIVYFALTTSSGTGTSKIYQLETRGSAECLRQLGHYCAIAPMVGVDSADLAVVDDYRALFASQANWWKGRTEIAGMNLLGTLYQFSVGAWNAVGSVAPWQMNYQVGAFGQVSDMEPIDDMTNWNIARDWQYKWPVGLCGTSGASNWCFTQAGSRYGLCVTDTDATTDETTFFDTWGECWDQTFGSPNSACAAGSALVGTVGQSDDPLLAATNHRWGTLIQAIAYAVDHGATGADAAWARLVGASNWDDIETGSAAPDNFNDTPIWGIYPRNAEPAWYAAMADGTWGTIAGGAGQTIGDHEQLPDPDVGYGPITEIVTAWTGAAVDSVRKEYLVVANGGHANYPGNEAYALDLTADAPVWRRIIDRTPDANMGDPTLPNGGLYADGRARAMHNGNEVWADGRVWFPMMNSVTSNEGVHANKVAAFNRDSLGAALTPQAWANNAGPWEFYGSSGANTTCYGFGFGVFDSVNHQVFGLANGACTGMFWWKFPTTGGSIGSSTAFETGTHIRPSWAVCAPDLGIIVVGDRDNSGRIAVLTIATNAWSFPAKSGTFHFGEGSGAVYIEANHTIAVGDPKELDSDFMKIVIPTTGSAYNPSGTFVGTRLTKTGGPDYVEPIWASTGIADFAFSKWNIVTFANGRSAIVFLCNTDGATYVYKIPEAGL